MVSFISRLMRGASRSPLIRLVVQKFRLMVFFTSIFNRLSQFGQKEKNGPIFFLGEKLIAFDEWEDRRSKIEPWINLTEVGVFDLENLLPMSPSKEYACTVISSIYKPGQHLGPFLRNLESQSIFKNVDCIFIGVQLSENEKLELEIFATTWTNVTNIFIEERISIYRAWNLAVEKSASEKLTNMNVDDVRHPQSLEIQVRELDTFSSVDVVYQDVYYAYENLKDWALIAGLDVRSTLPEVTTPVLARGINAPHNAPMWRKQLHSKVGLFDESFKSAGDHDFWIRSSISGATFRKSDFLHVSYFINPEGMSTKPKSPGASEGARILDKYSEYC